MPISFADLKVLHARTVRHSVDVVRQVSVAHLELPTPCDAWTLRDLLAHMTVQHRGFAAAAGGHGADPEVWVVQPLGDDAVDRYVDAADDLLTAFAKVDDPDRPFGLAEFSRARTFPASTAIGFHLIDYLVHGWDVAASLGVPFDPDPEVVQAALPIALAVPGGDARLAPGSAFQPVLPIADDADPFDRILTVLGRSPSWPAVEW
jgi:uncharacterized protein (TIGR03086 family)